MWVIAPMNAATSLQITLNPRPRAEMPTYERIRKIDQKAILS